MFTNEQMEIAVQSILNARDELKNGYEPVPVLDIEIDADLDEDAAQRLFDLMVSNDSPCWNCLEGLGDANRVVYDDASQQYLHETCEVVELN